MSEFKKNVKVVDNWVRGVYILIFAMIWAITEVILGFIVVFQFVSVVVTGKPNVPLKQFGKGLSTYVYQIMLFFTFNSDEKPFPFSDWPVDEQNEKNLTSTESL